MLFPYVTVLNHFILLQCPFIPRAKGTQSLIVAIVLSHFQLQKVLSHSLVLQWSVIPCCYSAQPFLIATVRGAVQSFCNMTELDGRRGWEVAHDSAVGRRTESRTRSVRAGGGSQLGRGAWGTWFGRAWSVETVTS
jgi:hypothetical protein